MLIFIFLPCLLPAQKFEIAAGMGYGACSMSDLKTLNEEIMMKLPFESEVVDDFPSWFVYRLSFAAMIGKRISLGGLYTHSSSGSRVSSADYSGEYYFDTRLAANSVGVQFGVKAFQHRNFDVRLKVVAGTILTHAGFHENLEVNGSRLSDEYTMNSLSFYFDPEIGVHYRFGMLGATVFGGYRFDAKGHLRYNSQETNLTTDWSGFNVGVELVVMIPFRKEKQKDKAVTILAR